MCADCADFLIGACLAFGLTLWSGGYLDFERAGRLAVRLIADIGVDCDPLALPPPCPN
jgi:hypothetical protein